jgi:hypothetical protein
MSVHFIGVRHHSPACAQLVRHYIRTHRPQAVLIEGPADFNPRLSELLLPHRLPIAIYSYANDEGQLAQQSWFPLLEFSPEWVALHEGAAMQAQLRFIDLPHWCYRTGTSAPRPSRQRYHDVMQALCRRTGCDSDDALWDHLFEALPPDDPSLGLRLDAYFAQLRGDELAQAADAQREESMATWIAWAAARFDRVLVVCGGWHVPALQRAWPTLSQLEEPMSPSPTQAEGSYLVPYEYGQVDALSGYAAGMPSPMFYQQLWQQGAAAAARWALQRIVERLRACQQPVSTADLIALEQHAEGLARLRGHAVPLRVDLLDAVQSTLVKDAQDAPAPWSTHGLLSAEHHPVLREALHALTGEGGGSIHTSTPLPPLVHDVNERLAACALHLQREPQPLILDRRRPLDLPRSQLLWQLHVLNVGGIELQSLEAPAGSTALNAALAFEEHWLLQKQRHWLPNLIAAAVYGATLPKAAEQLLLKRADNGCANNAQPKALVDALLTAIRAGLLALGDSFARRLQQSLVHTMDHGELAQACLSLVELSLAGFWGQDVHLLLQGTLLALAERLVWLLERRDGAGSAMWIEADVRSLIALQRLLGLDIAGLDQHVLISFCHRLASSADKPPALRGAALGVKVSQAGFPVPLTLRTEVIALMCGMSPRDALGDFLYGLFSLARALATEDDTIVHAVHAALQSLGDEDFLLALPSLRAAFAGFPPRERGAIAKLVVPLLGLPSQQRDPPPEHGSSAQPMLDAKRIETLALTWARTHGVLV